MPSYLKSKALSSSGNVEHHSPNDTASHRRKQHICEGLSLATHTALSCYTNFIASQIYDYTFSRKHYFTRYIYFIQSQSLSTQYVCNLCLRNINLVRHMQLGSQHIALRSPACPPPQMLYIQPSQRHVVILHYCAQKIISKQVHIVAHFIHVLDQT